MYYYGLISQRNGRIHVRKALILIYTAGDHDLQGKRSRSQCMSMGNQWRQWTSNVKVEMH